MITDKQTDKRTNYQFEYGIKPKSNFIQIDLQLDLTFLPILFLSILLRSED